MALGCKKEGESVMPFSAIPQSIVPARRPPALHHSLDELPTPFSRMLSTGRSVCRPSHGDEPVKRGQSKATMMKPSEARTAETLVERTPRQHDRKFLTLFVQPFVSCDHIFCTHSHWLTCDPTPSLAHDSARLCAAAAAAAAAAGSL